MECDAVDAETTTRRKFTRELYRQIFIYLIPYKMKGKYIV